MTQSVITGNFWEGERKSIYIIFRGHFELISLPNRLGSTLFSATGPCHLKLWGERLENTTFFKIPAETDRQLVSLEAATHDKVGLLPIKSLPSKFAYRHTIFMSPPYEQQFLLSRQPLEKQKTYPGACERKQPGAGYQACLIRE